MLLFSRLHSTTIIGHPGVMKRNNCSLVAGSLLKTFALALLKFNIIAVAVLGEVS